MFFHRFDKTMEEVKVDIDAGNAIQLVDVRFKEEYEEGHIKGALLLPLPQLEEKAPACLPDKEATLYVYCRSGQRSTKACTKLKALGYTHVYNIGGIIHWPYDMEKGSE